MGEPLEGAVDGHLMEKINEVANLGHGKKSDGRLSVNGSCRASDPRMKSRVNVGGGGDCYFGFAFHAGTREISGSSTNAPR